MKSNGVALMLHVKFSLILFYSSVFVVFIIFDQIYVCAGCFSKVTVNAAPRNGFLELQFL